jgi:FtsP/CotA-like multicopper oxidase with cupredoxin domain
LAGGDISRRRALQVAGLGLLSAGVGAAGLWQSVQQDDTATLPAGQEMAEAAGLSSLDGQLTVELVAAEGVQLDGRNTRAYGYNGTTPGPTLRVRPGDLLRVSLVNRLDAPTNLHVHGLHVSPEGAGDNAFVHVESGGRHDYEYRIPDDHPTGTFWYHPHLHGHVAEQVFGGLVGAIVVEERPLGVDAERIMLVTDTTVGADGRLTRPSTPELMMGREGQTVRVNGQLRPQLTARPGALERWRVVNACPSRFLRLRLDGHVLGLLGYDGQALHAPHERDEVLLAPGNRADLLVRAGRPGGYPMRTLPYDRGRMGPMARGRGARRSGEVVLADLLVGGEAQRRRSVPTLLPARDDLRDRPVDRRRTVTFDMGMGMGMGMRMGMGGMSFTIDGREFDADRVDQSVVPGALEEWTLRNASPMDHPLHLHVWPFQVVSQHGAPIDGPPDWRDTVNIPAHGEVVVRIPFTGVSGRTVYHCHVLDHEDNGMMAVVQASA